MEGRPGLLAVLLLVVVVVNAVPRQLMYPFGTQPGDKSLPPSDEWSSDEIGLTIPIVFFDTPFRAIYVNNNGHVSFDTEIPNYQGDLVLPIGLKLIAPFLADIDTRGAGRVFYRETQDENLLQRAAADVQSHFSGKGGFRPQALFIVTWDSVGYYDRQVDRLNTFQLVLVTDGVSSFAFFHYLDDSMQWVRSQGKLATRVPDVPAQAGFDRGNGQRQRNPTLPFSGSTAAFVNESNVNIPGVWMFQIGNTGPEGDVMPADLNTGTVTIFEVGVGQTCLEGARQCHMNARCLDYDEGFCCQCLPPFYGNGKHCLEPEIPQRLNGRVHGTINGVALAGLDMHTYVVTTDGRTYTAISRVPAVLGPAMETLSTVGGAIGWLFAVPTSDQAYNGFTFTGGAFNRTAVVNFMRGEVTTHTIRITQKFYGHDALNNLRMDTRMDGDMPDVADGAKVTIDDYSENYKRVQPGVVKSFSVRTYRVNDVAFRYTWDQTLSFEECEADPSPSTHTMRLSVSRNFVRHSEKDQVVRYAMSNKVSVMTGSDPCFDATQTCHEHADCVPADASFRCVCRAGYKGDGMDCQDIDECAMELNVCDENARCFNVYGSFQCQCLSGYQGDGYTCSRDATLCSGQYCGDNARCVFNSEVDRPQCECNPGFRGDGVTCSAVEFRCNEANVCSENAECVLDPDTNEYECQCVDDFSGDGYTCESIDRADCQHCSRDSDCVYDLERLVFRCNCRAGFTGNGVTCTPMDRCGQCDANADCNFDPRTNQFQCRCRYGFYGDGQRCAEYDCREDNVCDRNAACDFDVNYNAFLCRCPGGYTGDGFRCEAEGCDVFNDCDVNARCMPAGDRYTCQCNPGFQGDGKVCLQPVVPCNQVNNCDRNAECLYDPDAMSYRCRCSRGYDGDGLTCSRRDLPDCRSQQGLCDRNAACVEGADGLYVCVCNPSYRGDGSSCTVAVREGERLVYARGRKVFAVSTSPQPGDYGQQLAFNPGQLAVAVDTDCAEGHIYFGDAAYGVIRRTTLNGSASQDILTGLGSPEGIAVDFVSRTLYYTDSRLDVVGVALLDGTYRKTLFNTDMVNPRAIALDVTRGQIYWTDWNRNKPQIETANTDGTERRVLVSEDLRLPNGLAFDHFSQQLCWADAGSKRLECVRSDGVGRRIVSSAPNYPFSVTMLNNILYWTDWERRTISGVRQSGGEEISPISAAIGGNGRLYGITALRDQCPRGSNSCAFNNGGCEFLCLPTPSGGRTCACPDGVDPRVCQETNRT
ncbi:nidogen-like [Littorina saxatilis]|uniref:Uncharacterized protein n=1 Tax=Littorina saxatilis TaxID=31220 RepID=A0AAN9BE10_9CAEN